MTPPTVPEAGPQPVEGSRPGDLDEKGIADLRKVFPAAIARIEAEARPSVEALAAALKAEGFVRGVAARYGTFNDPYWEQSAEALLSALNEMDVPR